MLSLREIRRVNNQTIRKSKKIAGRVCDHKAIEMDLSVIETNVYCDQNMPSTWTWRSFSSRSVSWRKSVSMSGSSLGWTVIAVWSIEYTIVWGCRGGSWSKETHGESVVWKWWCKLFICKLAMCTLRGCGFPLAMPGLLDPYPGVDRHSCQLLGPTALVFILSHFSSIHILNTV